MEDTGSTTAPAAPASWLWDPVRLRILWANRAGLDWFGAETLFDLIDRSFDPAEPGPARIRAAFENGISDGGQRLFLAFPSAGKSEAVPMRLTPEPLTDGRTGIRAVLEQAESPRSDLLAAIFDRLPEAAAAISRDGTLILRNAEWRDMMPQSGQFAPVAQRLDHLAEAGTISDRLIGLETRRGLRDMRMTLRKLTMPDLPDLAALVTLEDITERRHLEKSLAETPASAAPLPAPTPVVAAQAAPLSDDESRAFANLGRLIAGEIGEPAAAATSPKPAADPASVPQVLRNLFDQTADPILIIRAKALLFANARAQTLLGYQRPAELLARADIADRLASSAANRPVTLTAADGTPLSFTVRLTSIAWYGGPATQAVLHQQPTATAQTDAGDAELRAILDTASDGIITLDREGRIRSFSGGAEALFGRARADVLGEPLTSLMAAESRKSLKDYLASLSDSGLATIFNDGRELLALAGAGSVPVFLTLSRLQVPANGAAFCAVVRDITQWKKTETELRAAKDSAERASRQKSEFLAHISHELRTPLNAILGFSDVMRQGRLGDIGNERYREYANDIHSSGSHLLSLINDLLDLSKVEAGKLELDFTSVDLTTAVAGAIKLLAITAAEARVLIRTNIPDDLPAVVADVRAIKQILLNLISNAVKFTAPGGQIIISASLARSGELKLRIKDTGVGMSASELKDALEPFRRVTSSSRPDFQGTGLGLPLTRALVEANRAAFTISSEPGKGTLAEITFPTTRVLAG